MKKVLLIAVLAIVLVVSLAAQSGVHGKGKAKGKVLDDKTGQPLEGVTVKLFSVRGPVVLCSQPQDRERRHLEGPLPARRLLEHRFRKSGI